MIASRTPLNVARVAELAAQGFSHRWIARRLGLDRDTVAGILRQAAPQAAEITLPPGDLPTRNDDPPGFDSANIRRCRGCGALVYLWPCLACCLATESAETSADQ